jgi:hypothetical protein
LSKTEEATASAAKLLAEEQATAAGDDEDVAAAKGDAAYKRHACKAKLSKSYAKQQRKLPAAPAGVDPAAPPPLPDQPPLLYAPAPDEAGAKQAAYQEHIQAAYNRIIGHRVFRDVGTLEPNPIQQADAGDCGVQDFLGLRHVL